MRSCRRICGGGPPAALAGERRDIRAYNHLELRADPEPAVKPVVDELRAELARLVAEAGRLTEGAAGSRQRQENWAVVGQPSIQRLPSAAEIRAQVEVHHQRVAA
jgi:hypothetical protein